MLAVHAAESGSLVRAFSLPLSEHTGLPSAPTALQVVDTHTALVGFSDGVMRIFDLRSGGVAMLLRLSKDSVRRWRSGNRSATASAYGASAGGANALPQAGGASVTSASFLDEELLHGSWIHPDASHTPGDTTRAAAAGSLLHDLPVDADCAIEHLHKQPGRFEVVESRVSPLSPLPGTPEALFSPLSSPFVRLWDLRMSASSPFHVLDLGPRSLRAIAGLGYDEDRLVVASQHLYQPRRAEDRAAEIARVGAGGGAPTAFHWNVRDRARAAAAAAAGATTGGTDAAGVGDAGGQGRATGASGGAGAGCAMWRDVVESDLPVDALPRYMWPVGHAPPLSRHTGDTAPVAAGLAVATTTGNSHAPAAGAVGATHTDNDDEEDRSPFARAARRQFAEFSTLSVWHPHALSLCAAVPLQSATALCMSRSLLAVGTDYGALYFNTTAAT